MKKLNNIFTLLVVALAGLSLTACSNNDLDTDQYTDGVSLGAFGPSPVLRGGTLYFYGSNLNQITEVILPGQTSPVTDIKVLESGRHSKISIMVPTEGGTEGKVTLKANDGTKITTASKLTFREDIAISKVYINTDGNTTGEVGDLLVVEGDYLNLMSGVIFTGGFTVTDLEEHTRYKMSVRIPKEAASGKITLTDLAEDTPTELQAETEITIKLPEATAAAVTKKAGETITITGSRLNQIESILLPNNVTIAEADITRAEDGRSLSFALPEAAADGDITLVTYSGQKIAAGTITTVTPTGLAVVGKVKNGLQMVVKGTNMHLVKSVTFADAVDATDITVEAGKVTIAKVPEAAVDGNLTMTMLNGKQVTVAYTLVKPTVTSADPATVTAGEETIIYGNDLDLVAAIIFPGDAEQTVLAKDFTAQEAEGIQLTTPAASVGSGMKLVMKNGTEIAISGKLTIKGATNPAISEAPASALAGDEITVKGKNFNNVANVYIGTYKVTRYTSKSNTEMIFKVPDAPVGDYNFVLEDYDGNKFNGPAFSVAPAEITIWEGNADNMSAWNNIEGVGSDAGTELKAAGAQAGWIARFYGEFSTSWFELRVIEGHWGDTYATFGVNDVQNGCVQMVLTQAILDNAYQQQWWGGTFIVSGQGFILKKVTVASK